MKLGIFGSRTITDNRVKIEIADWLRQNSQYYDTIVTTQEPKGVCQLAQIFAKENAMVLELHFLDIAKYARGAFEHRSDEVIKSSDFVLLIHDGDSKGTKNELMRVKKFKKPYKYVKMAKTTELQNSETTDILKKENVSNVFKFMPLKEIREEHKKYDIYGVLLVEDNYIPSDYKSPFAISANPILNDLLEKGYEIIQDKYKFYYEIGGKVLNKVLVQACRK